MLQLYIIKCGQDCNENYFVTEKVVLSREKFLDHVRLTGAKNILDNDFRDFKKSIYNCLIIKSSEVIRADIADRLNKLLKNLKARFT